MKICIVIPAHNEGEYLSKTLSSLTDQTLLPSRLIVVDDHSTDNTAEIANDFAGRFHWISVINHNAFDPGTGMTHSPGSKVIKAFQAGYKLLDNNYDLLCKFDADLIFPRDYLERIAEKFRQDPKCGMAGGFCYIVKDGEWVLESLTGPDHIRGALKAYRKECYRDIGGLKPDMGWDTVDEMLARYHGWEVVTLPELRVKHLKPTGSKYGKGSGKLQGHAFRRMRYGWILSRIAALKLAFSKGNLRYFFDCMNGYAIYPESYLVSKEEGKFIRRYRWRNIKKKLF